MSRKDKSCLMFAVLFYQGYAIDVRANILQGKDEFKSMRPDTRFIVKMYKTLRFIIFVREVTLDTYLLMNTASVLLSARQISETEDLCNIAGYLTLARQSRPYSSDRIIIHMTEHRLAN